MTKKRIILHIDVNNAFLSWTAVDLLRKGHPIDIRTIPSVIGGDEEKRRGIVTAKSPVAKKMGVVTAEPLYMARRKCPNLQVFRGDYDLYHRESEKLYQYFLNITPTVERFSIDECFLDISDMNLIYKDPLELAKTMREYINKNFGITVNIGIANCKLCAKMASDFEKPNKIHTLFDEEVQTKMWPLPVSDLFMVGKKSAEILVQLGIKTIGDLANTDLEILRKYFKSQAIVMQEHARGIDESKVERRIAKNQSISVSETLEKDITDKKELKHILLRQADRVGRTARNKKLYATTIAVIFKTNEFKSYSHQTKLVNPTNATEDIFKQAIKVLDNGYRGEPIRLIGLRLNDFVKENIKQVSLFEEEKDTNSDKVQEVIDNIKDKFGDGIIIPASLKEIEENSEDN